MNYDASSETISKLDRVLDEIRLFVRQGFSADPILVRDVAVEYAEACAYTNQRLHKISRLLRQGLTGEAIQLADQSPAILPLAKQLSFPDADQWSSLLYQLNLEQPPAISLDAIQEFEAAHENYHRLQTLLDQHRLLALARAPLSSRILVLRKIRRREPDNPAWKSDLMAWETQRLVQIPNELKIAAQKHDLGKLVDLRLELKSSWLQVVPDELTEQSRRELANEKARRSKSSMATAVSQFAAARAAGDVESALDAQDQLRELGDQVRSATIASPQASSEDIQWLEKQQQEANADREFAAEVEAIGNMIAFKAKPTVVQQRLHTLELLDQPIPATLLERAEHYFSVCKRRQRNKLGLRIAAIGLGIAAIVASLYGIIRSAANRREISASIEKIEKLSATEDFIKAREFTENPRFANTQRIIELRSEIDAKLVAIKSFDAAYDKIKNSVDADFNRITRPQMDNLQKLAVTTIQTNLAKNLDLKWQKLTNQENPDVERCTLEAKRLMFRLPESVSKLEEIRQILDDLISKSGADFETAPKLNSIQLKQANDVLDFVKNGLTAAKANPITDLEEFPDDIGELAKLPSSIHSRTDLKLSTEESELWTAYRDSQDIAIALSPEAFATMSVENLTNQLKQVKILNSEINLIGEKTAIDNLVIGIEKILENHKNYGKVPRKALANINRILLPQLPSSAENPLLQPRKGGTSSSAPDTNAIPSNLAASLGKILRDDGLATIEAMYIKIIDCLCNEPDNGANLEIRGRIVQDLNSDFKANSDAIQDALSDIEKSSNANRGGNFGTAGIPPNNDQSAGEYFSNLKTGWPKARRIILAQFASKIALVKWREQFDYECIGWLYQLPACGDEQGVLPFTIVGKQSNIKKVEIYCLIPIDGVNEMVRVGELRDVTAQPSQGQRLQTGRPVFVKNKPN